MVHAYYYIVARVQLHPVQHHHGDRWTRQQSGPRLARPSDGSEPGEQVPSQDDHPWTTTATVLRDAMQALVRVQARMLARIVVATVPIATIAIAS